MMKPQGMLLGLTYAVIGVMAFGLGGVVHSQTSGPPPTPEQEFLDSIKKGNATRVSELLKENPTLIGATTKNGTTAVLLAVYARHPEIAEMLLATGVEPNVFEAAATGRLERVRELLQKNPELVKLYSPDGWQRSTSASVTLQL